MFDDDETDNFGGRGGGFDCGAHVYNVSVGRPGINDPKMMESIGRFKVAMSTSMPSWMCSPPLASEAPVVAYSSMMIHRNDKITDGKTFEASSSPRPAVVQAVGRGSCSRSE